MLGRKKRGIVMGNGTARCAGMWVNDGGLQGKVQCPFCARQGTVWIHRVGIHEVAG